MNNQTQYSVPLPPPAILDDLKKFFTLLPQEPSSRSPDNRLQLCRSLWNKAEGLTSDEARRAIFMLLIAYQSLDSMSLFDPKSTLSFKIADQETANRLIRVAYKIQIQMQTNQVNPPLTGWGKLILWFKYQYLKLRQWLNWKENIQDLLQTLDRRGPKDLLPLLCRLPQYKSLIPQQSDLPDPDALLSQKIRVDITTILSSGQAQLLQTVLFPNLSTPTPELTPNETSVLPLNTLNTLQSKIPSSIPEVSPRAAVGPPEVPTTEEEAAHHASSFSQADPTYPNSTHDESPSPVAPAPTTETSALPEAASPLATRAAPDPLPEKATEVISTRLPALDSDTVASISLPKDAPLAEQSLLKAIPSSPTLATPPSIVEKERPSPKLLSQSAPTFTHTPESSSPAALASSTIPVASPFNEASSLPEATSPLATQAAPNPLPAGAILPDAPPGPFNKDPLSSSSLSLTQASAGRESDIPFFAPNPNAISVEEAIKQYTLGSLTEDPDLATHLTAVEFQTHYFPRLEDSIASEEKYNQFATELSPEVLIACLRNFPPSVPMQTNFFGVIIAAAFTHTLCFNKGESAPVLKEYWLKPFAKFDESSIENLRNTILVNFKKFSIFQKVTIFECLNAQATQLENQQKDLTKAISTLVTFYSPQQAELNDRLAIITKESSLSTSIKLAQLKESLSEQRARAQEKLAKQEKKIKSAGEALAKKRQEVGTQDLGRNRQLEEEAYGPGYWVVGEKSIIESEIKSIDAQFQLCALRDKLFALRELSGQLYQAVPSTLKEFLTNNRYIETSQADMLLKIVSFAPSHQPIFDDRTVFPKPPVTRESLLALLLPHSSKFTPAQQQYIKSTPAIEQAARGAIEHQTLPTLSLGWLSSKIADPTSTPALLLASPFPSREIESSDINQLVTSLMNASPDAPLNEDDANKIIRIAFGDNENLPTAETCEFRKAIFPRLRVFSVDAQIKIHLLHTKALKHPGYQNVQFQVYPFKGSYHKPTSLELEQSIWSSSYMKTLSAQELIHALYDLDPASPIQEGLFDTVLQVAFENVIAKVTDGAGAKTTLSRNGLPDSTQITPNERVDVRTAALVNAHKFSRAQQDLLVLAVFNNFREIRLPVPQGFDWQDYQKKVDHPLNHFSEEEIQAFCKMVEEKTSRELKETLQNKEDDYPTIPEDTFFQLLFLTFHVISSKDYMHTYYMPFSFKQMYHINLDGRSGDSKRYKIEEHLSKEDFPLVHLNLSYLYFMLYLLEFSFSLQDQEDQGKQYLIEIALTFSLNRETRDEVCKKFHLDSEHYSEKVKKLVEFMTDITNRYQTARQELFPGEEFSQPSYDCFEGISAADFLETLYVKDEAGKETCLSSLIPDLFSSLANRSGEEEVPMGPSST